MTAAAPDASFPMRQASWWRTGASLAIATASLSAFYLWSYHDSLKTFFHFDDFWVLAAAGNVHLDSPRDLLQFFRPINGFLLYRPISTVLYFFVLHQCFGYDPTGYHATQIAFHILNALLVYAIADTLLWSRPLAWATALLYATAPGHAIAVYWNALFTITGTAFFYFLGLWAWLRLDSRWRIPITFVLFVMALLSSEHAVTFPLVLTLAAVLLPTQRDWRRLAREQAPFYAVTVCYLAAKLYYLRYLLPRDFPDLGAQVYIAEGYHLSFAPLSVLRQLGYYLTFSIDLAYGTVSSDSGAVLLGIGVTALAVSATLLVLSNRWTVRPLRVAAFGVDVFVVALAPLLVLPAHLFSYYVGIAALGMALALIGFAQAVPTAARRVGPWVVVAALVGTHVLSTVSLVRRSEEFRFFDGFSNAAARWLYTLSRVPNYDGLKEIMVPANGLTDMVFARARAHELLLCAHYAVHTVNDMDDIQIAPGRLIIREPRQLPERASGRWPWLPRSCANGRNRGSP